MAFTCPPASSGPTPRSRDEVNDSWIRAVVLICVLGAVVLAVEAIVRSFTDRRFHGKAVNYRLKLIGQGRTREEALSIMRGTRGDIAQFAPLQLRTMAEHFDRL